MSSRDALREALEKLDEPFSSCACVRDSVSVPREYLDDLRDALATPDTGGDGLLRLEGTYTGVRHGNAAIPAKMTASEIFDLISDTGECGTCGGAKWVGTKMSATWDEGEGPCPDCTGEATEGERKPVASDISSMMHAVGWPKCYRNYYAVGPETERCKRIEELVVSGWWVHGREVPGGLRYYHLSEKGQQFLERHFRSHTATEGERENATTHRSNIQDVDGGVELCRGDHDKDEPCEWEFYATPPATEAASDSDTVPTRQMNHASYDAFMAGWERAAGDPTDDVAYRAWLDWWEATPEPAWGDTDTASDPDTGAGDAPTDQPAESVGMVEVGSEDAYCSCNDAGASILLVPDCGHFGPDDRRFDLVPRTPKETTDE